MGNPKYRRRHLLPPIPAATKFRIRIILNQAKYTKMRRRIRRGGKRNTEKRNPHLPLELITEILLKLPVKSLLCFKCVCKSWLSIISDPHFATSHFELSATRNRRILFLAPDPTEALTIDFNVSFYYDFANDDLELGFLHDPSYLEIGGSCRGFLFLHGYDGDIYLWNPSTGAHKYVPWSPNVTKVDSSFLPFLYGFGYDPAKDDYLVVLWVYDPRLVNDLTCLEFFSVRDNTWNEVEGIHLPYMNSSDYPSVGKLFNGAIHWVVYREDLSLNVIVAFDLTERRISEIALPDDFNHEDRVNCDLWVFEEFLSLWIMENDQVDIWVMKEYAVSSSWTKTRVLSIDPTRFFSLICLTKRGDIVVSDGDTGLVRYNDKGQLIEHRSYRNGSHGSPFMTLYTESLLSLPGGW